MESFSLKQKSELQKMACWHHITWVHTAAPIGIKPKPALLLPLLTGVLVLCCGCRQEGVRGPKHSSPEPDSCPSSPKNHSTVSISAHVFVCLFVSLAVCRTSCEHVTNPILESCAALLLAVSHIQLQMCNNNSKIYFSLDFYTLFFIYISSNS